MPANRCNQTANHRGAIRGLIINAIIPSTPQQHIRSLLNRLKNISFSLDQLDGSSQDHRVMKSGCSRSSKASTL
ncbi:hypothetical protein CHUAL_013610 [Chamberlinius hualienensis]